MIHRLTKQLTAEEVVALIGDGTRLTVRLLVPLGDLIRRDIDELNDLMDELILPEGCDLVSPCLSGVTYRVVGHREVGLAPNHFCDGYVLLEVSGDVEVYDA